MGSYYKKSLLLTPLLLLAAMLLMGGGHGYYAPAIALFPTGLISFSIQSEITTPFILLAICQFPIYGLLLDKTTNTRKALLLISVFHMGLVLITFLTIKDI